MSFKKKPFFYDAQIKRLLVQIMSCFAGYQVMTGTTREGKSEFMDVPIIYGDMSRVAGYILQGGNENRMQYLPVMSCYMTSIKQNANLRTGAQHKEKYSFIERAKTLDGELLINQPGKKKTIERYMPVPYDLGFTIAFWASNVDQGFQIIEQICTTYAPLMDVQLSNSPADWTFLTSLEFSGEVNMEKAVPSGTTTDPLLIYNFPFSTVIWLSAPVKVYETKYIYEINVPISEIEGGVDFDEYKPLDGLVIKADKDDILFFESLQ